MPVRLGEQTWPALPARWEIPTIATAAMIAAVVNGMYVSLYATLLGIGTIVMMLLGRRDEIITTAITTAVVMVVAAISPGEAWHQPLLRLVDTAVGIGIGVGAKWIASSLLCPLIEGRSRRVRR